MRVLVTGGAGYVGSVAVERLLERGYDVVVVDNMRTGRPAAVERGATVIEGDLRDTEGLCRTVAETSPGAILHFAAAAVVPESIVDPALYYSVNASGSLNLLMAARNSGVERFIFSSTAAVYGAPARVPIGESEPLLPVNPYGRSKLMAEQMLESFAAAYGIKYAAMRYFNVAGATAKHGEDHRPETHLIPIALQAAAGLRPPLEIFGSDYPTPDGTAIRDYIHVVDLIDAHLNALDRLDDIQGAFNLGTTVGASVDKVVSVVEAVTGKSVPRTYQDRRQGDSPVLVADSSRARQRLDWIPKRSTLEEMIGSAWDWMQRYPDGYLPAMGPVHRGRGN